MHAVNFEPVVFIRIAFKNYIASDPWPLFFLFVGMLNLIGPEITLRWTIRSGREITEKKSALITTRFIGVGLVGAGLVALTNQ